MDAALRELRTAVTVEEKVAALEQIARVWTEDVPAVSLVHFPSYVAWNDDVHGVRTTAGVVALYDKAWVSR